MTCANHPEAPSVAFCRTCGKPLCAECRKEALGTVFCAEHVPATATVVDRTPSPYTTPIASSGTGSPALAFILGFIPGVGAIFNGQYAKGLVHAVIFGVFVTMLNSHISNNLEPLIGICLAGWVFYMAFEAYHTAQKRRSGKAVDELSGLWEGASSSTGFPIGAIVLIGLGVLLLLETTGLLDIDRILQFWPVLLILIGSFMLYNRLSLRARSNHDAALNETGGDANRF